MIQRSSAQKSIDRENAPIQDQYFIFVLIIGYTLNGNDSNLLIVFYVQIMPDDFVMQLHRF